MSHSGHGVLEYPIVKSRECAPGVPVHRQKLSDKPRTSVGRKVPETADRRFYTICLCASDRHSETETRFEGRVLRGGALRGENSMRSFNPEFPNPGFPIRSTA